MKLLVLELLPDDPTQAVNRYLLCFQFKNVNTLVIGFAKGRSRFLLI